MKNNEYLRPCEECDYYSPEPCPECKGTGFYADSVGNVSVSSAGVIFNSDGCMGHWYDWHECTDEMLHAAIGALENHIATIRQQLKARTSDA